jgi:hypothetical protein
MTKLTKGTEVYYFVDWDEKGTCAVRRCVVGSWGKEQGFLYEARPDGQPLRHRIYTQRESMTRRILPVADVPDVNATALRFGAEFRAHWQAHCELRIQQWGATDAGFRQVMLDNIAALHEPRVLFPWER